MYKSISKNKGWKLKTDKNGLKQSHVLKNEILIIVSSDISTK